MIQINKNPSIRELKQFSRIWLPLLSILLGYIFFSKLHIPHIAVVILVSGAFTSLFGVFFPGRIKPVFVALIYITYPIGFILSYFILALLFFFLLTPIALIMRIFNFDPIERSSDKTKKSYWKTIEHSDKTEQYFKQY
ncbi:MAG: hypothetical protein P9M03_11760 [Candidatus Theseobacter exili]|nr:hypothetical protein [Candidatus Theseobacter exili]